MPASTLVPAGCSQSASVAARCARRMSCVSRRTPAVAGRMEASVGRHPGIEQAGCLERGLQPGARIRADLLAEVDQLPERRAGPVDAGPSRAERRDRGRSLLALPQTIAFRHELRRFGLERLPLFRQASVTSGQPLARALQRALQRAAGRVLVLDRDDPGCETLQRDLRVGDDQLLQAVEVPLPSLEQRAACMLHRIVGGGATGRGGLVLVRTLVARPGLLRHAPAAPGPPRGVAGAMRRPVRVAGRARRATRHSPHRDPCCRARRDRTRRRSRADWRSTRRRVPPACAASTALERTADKAVSACARWRCRSDAASLSRSRLRVASCAARSASAASRSRSPASLAAASSRPASRLSGSERNTSSRVRPDARAAFAC